MKIFFKLLFILVFNIGFCQQSSNIFEAARNGEVQVIKNILKENPEVVNTKNKEGFSALTLACYRGNTEVVKLLLKKKADVNISSSMGSPLMAATYKGHLEIVKLLLSKNVNVDEVDQNGTTSLMFATMFKNIELVKLLISKKADKTIKDKSGKTAFEYATITGEEMIINLLK